MKHKLDPIIPRAFVFFSGANRERLSSEKSLSYNFPSISTASGKRLDAFVSPCRQPSRRAFPKLGSPVAKSPLPPARPRAREREQGVK